APVPADAIELIGVEYNIEITVEDEVTYEEQVLRIGPPKVDDPDQEVRPPVIAVLGHVDHGKTTLLDTIRKTKRPVASKEAGGITQHIGAYMAEHNGQKMCFIDTPGHQAFTELRARGANATDLVLLVVAADDGIMPQTKEAIQHAQAAGAHIIVAANKIDKANADVDKLLQGLTAIEGMLPQEFGGETEVARVSAIKGTGIDDLLETILAYAEILELKANPKLQARGTVLEARLDKGRGIVATVLVQDGTLRRGDSMLADHAGGRVRMMFDDNGKQTKEAGPSTPVEVLGLDKVPAAGSSFYTVAKDSDMKAILSERRAGADGPADTATPKSVGDVWRVLQEQEVKEVRAIVRADVQGSLQVLKREMTNLSTDEVKIRVILDGVGGVTTSDVQLAQASEAVVMGFGVTAEPKARALAKELGVDIRTHRVIYTLLDDCKVVMGEALEPEEQENVLGSVEVRKVFKSSKLGMIAGCFVEDGIVRRDAQIRLVRDGIVLWQGGLDSLRRFKDDVKEVRENFECGIKLRNYDNIQSGDRLEVFEIKKIARTID
ncbi:translation initiation factor IF-2, partial [Planctomycetota bacterium]|nr:translation initiation factor IF-2 [Planctomycetota bacterium]